MTTTSRCRRKAKVPGPDFRFLAGTELFAAVPERGRLSLLDCMVPITLRAGERFIHQGDKGDCLYLIKEGSCIASVEQDGIVRDLARRESGELVGEMALVTDGHRTAHVQAETDMTLWSISRTEFNELCRIYPGLRTFVTELVTSRISESRLPVHPTVGDQYRSPAMRETLSFIRRVAKTNSTCLFLGETGVGKDYLARFLHDNSPLSRGPFFSVNCPSLGGELADSELFGHEAGAFTGASGRKRGLLELAEGGTLLLNEIGDLPLHIQAKLLAFLDTRSFTRVGGTNSITANCRIVATTNCDLEKEVVAGRFRADLFYRLSVMIIRVPPLRRRLEDLPLLVERLLEHLSRQMFLGRKPLMDSSLMDVLSKYHWPGNVRELRNVLERALVLTEGKRIGRDVIDLMQCEHPAEDSGALSVTVKLSEKTTLPDALVQAKRFVISDALARTTGNVTAAARLLGITRDNMKYYMKALGIRHAPR